MNADERARMFSGQMPVDEFLSHYTESPKFLIIEDQPEMIQLLKDVLGLFECELTFASNGHEAALRMQESGFDLIFLDLVLPDMSTTDLSRHIAVDQPLTPVIIVSGIIDSRIMHMVTAILDRPLWWIDKPICINPDRFARMFSLLRIRVKSLQPLVPPATTCLKWTPGKESQCECAAKSNHKP